MMESKLEVLATSIEGRKNIVDLKIQTLEAEVRILHKIKGGRIAERVVMGGASAILLYFLGALLGLFSIPMVNAGVMKAVTFVNHVIS